MFHVKHSNKICCPTGISGRKEKIMVERYLKSKNIPATSMGFIYLVDAIEMVINDRTLAYHIVRDVYIPIGKNMENRKHRLNVLLDIV